MRDVSIDVARDVVLPDVGTDTLDRGQTLHGGCGCATPGAPLRVSSMAWSLALVFVLRRRRSVTR